MYCKFGTNVCCALHTEHCENWLCVDRNMPLKLIVMYAHWRSLV